MQETYTHNRLLDAVYTWHKRKSFRFICENNSKRKIHAVMKLMDATRKLR